MPKYMTGHLPDPPEVVARRAGFHLFKAKRGLGDAPPPLKSENRIHLAVANGGPGILNQADTSSCEGHAHGSGATLRSAIEGKPGPLLSPIAPYTFARMMGRQPGPDGRLPPLADEGTYPSMLLAGMAEWGLCSANDYGDYPASSLTINREPTNLAQLEKCALLKLDGAYFLKSSGDEYVKDLMIALAAGFPCTAAIAASSDAFQEYVGGVLGPLDDAVDHATLWVDYEWDGANLSSLIVYGVNSWGEGWGEADAPGVTGGMYRANRDFVGKYSSSVAVLNLQRLAA